MTKPNSPPGPSSSAISAPTREGRPKSARQTIENQSLEADQRRGEAEDEPGLGGDQGGIDLGADRDEVEPEQQALERLDRHFDLAPVFGFRQQQPRDEGAERHGKLARRRGEAVAEHHQQAGGHEEFRALRLGDEMEERPQREPAEDDQRGERERGRNQPADQRRAEPAFAAAGEGARRDEERSDREILEEQHREARASDGRAEALAFDEDGDDDGGRRHRQRAADRQRRRRLQAEPPADRRQDQHRDDDLRQPQPEHQPAHEPQALERQFEPHGEQERDHPEGGELVDRLDIDRECVEPMRLSRQRPEPVRPERDAREEIAEHRADPEPEEQRRDDAGCRQEQQSLFVEGKIDGLVHGGQLSRFEPAREPRLSGQRRMPCRRQTFPARIGSYHHLIVD